MLKKRYLVLFMLILFVIFIYKITKKEYGPIRTYDDTKTPFQNKLMKFDYEPNNIGKINMYLITGSEENLNFNKITISSGDNITLNVKKHETFIISLLANSTISSKWRLKSEDSTSKNLILEKEERLNPFKPIHKNYDGESYSRQFFYFKAPNIDNTNLNFQYTRDEKYDDSETNLFKFKININILK